MTAAFMWWKRRPRGALGAPRYPADFRIPRAILIVAIVVGVALPLVGASILAMLAIDASLPRAWRERISPRRCRSHRLPRIAEYLVLTKLV